MDKAKTTTKAKLKTQLNPAMLKLEDTCLNEDSITNDLLMYQKLTRSNQHLHKVCAKLETKE